MQLGQHGLKICPAGATEPHHRSATFRTAFEMELSAHQHQILEKPSMKMTSSASNPPGMPDWSGSLPEQSTLTGVDHDQILSIHFAGPPDSFSMAMPGGLRLQLRELKTARACIHIARLVRPGDEDSSEGVSLRKAGTGCHCKWSSWHQALARSTYDGKPSLDYSPYRWPE